MHIPNKLQLINIVRNAKNNTFCPLPWIHQYVHQDGEVELCSISGTIGHAHAGPSVGSIRTSSLKDLWNNDYMKQARLEMLNNIRPQACLRCRLVEDIGYRSDRHEFIDRFNNMAMSAVLQTNFDGSLNTHELKYIDFRFSNVCYMACRMCNKESSSEYAKEENVLKNTTHKIVYIAGNHKTHAYDELKRHYDTMQEIFFGGGDIFLHWEHSQILDDLIRIGRAKDITLKYITNGNQITKRADMFDVWSKFKGVVVIFSIDGFREPGEYWRYGGDWNTIENNIRRCDSTEKIYPYIHSTLAWPNIFNWIEFIKYYFSSPLLKNTSSMSGYCLEGPLEFSLQSAPEFKKKQIEKALLELKTHIQSYKNNQRVLSLIDYAITYMYQQDTQYALKELPRMIAQDKLRNQDFFTAFPEHEDMRQYFIGTGEV